MPKIFERKSIALPSHTSKIDLNAPPFVPTFKGVLVKTLAIPNATEPIVVVPISRISRPSHEKEKEKISTVTFAMDTRMTDSNNDGEALSKDETLRRTIRKD